MGTNPKPQRYIGCMTGTSVDGLDLALIEIETDQINIHCADSLALPDSLRAQLLALGQPDENKSLDDLGEADAELGDFIGHAINKFIRNRKIDPDSIIAVGSHGQTVRHRPGRFTLQIGDPNRIAEITGITTVADFRRRDVAAGGQGAPLVPPFHQALFTDVSDVAVLNIGGISNVTVLADEVLGFDTGPGNGLMDSWYCHHHPARVENFDARGQWAARGQVDQQLLTTLLSDNYFQLPPPKSSGREYFNLNWLQSQLHNQDPTSVQATLCELTVSCIAEAVKLWAPDSKHLIVCGGGRLNTQLMSRLKDRVDMLVSVSEDWQVDGDALEAAAFAWLAYCTLHGLPGNLASVTGADGPRLLGGIYGAMPG